MDSLSFFSRCFYPAASEVFHPERRDHGFDGVSNAPTRRSLMRFGSFWSHHAVRQPHVRRIDNNDPYCGGNSNSFPARAVYGNDIPSWNEGGGDEVHGVNALALGH